MNPARTPQSLPQLQLRSELARLCLPAANRDPDRKLAWVCSICLLFLLIGIFGAKAPVSAITPVKPFDDALPVILEQATPPPTVTTEPQKIEEPAKSTADAPQIVAVNLDSPAINFAVPAIGNILLPKGMVALSQITPLPDKGMVAMPQTTALRETAPIKRLPAALNSTGRTGERPAPEYPPLALRRGLQGSVTLSITVDESGLITAIAVKRSSGYSLLDHSALDFVKKHWIIPPAADSRQYESTITYRLR